jgi:hypothetical protein
MLLRLPLRKPCPLPPSPPRSKSPLLNRRKKTHCLLAKVVHLKPARQDNPRRNQQLLRVL